MKTLFRTGHLASCSDWVECACARWQYLITGFLAIVAASSSGAIGYNSSMALLSEAPHGLVDGISDFIAFGLVVWYGKEKDEGKWHWLLAALLFGATGWIAFEAYQRMYLESYPVSGPYALLGSLIGLGIHYLRRGFVRTTGPLTKVRGGVIGHINADIAHMQIASVLAVILIILGTLSLVSWMKWFDLGLTFILVMRMTRQSWRIATGHGCGHSHGDSDGDDDHEGHDHEGACVNDH